MTDKMPPQPNAEAIKAPPSSSPKPTSSPNSANATQPIAPSSNTNGTGSPESPSHNASSEYADGSGRLQSQPQPSSAVPIPQEPPPMASSEVPLSSSLVTPPIASVPYPPQQPIPEEFALHPAGSPLYAVVLDVPPETVGWIIGKGGETIREMMIRSGAHIEFDRVDPGSVQSVRSLTVTGTVPQVDFARSLIWEKVTAVMTGSVEREPALEMWIPLDRVGMIIGARGSVIRMLQEQSGATIVVHNDQVNANNEKLLTIAGTPDQIGMARNLILETVNKPRAGPSSIVMQPGYYSQFSSAMGYGAHGPYPLQGMVMDSAPQSKTVYVPNSCVGIVIGKKGETIRDLQMRSGAHIKVTPDRECPADAADRLVTICGSPAAIDLAHTLLTDVVNEGLQRQNGGNQPAPSPDAFPAPSSGEATAAPGGSSTPLESGVPRYARPSGSIVTTLEVPNDKVGLIIGKQGVTIRDLQSRSGARIVVAKEDDAAREKSSRVITLTGPPNFVDMAKTLILERLSSNYPAGTATSQIPPRSFVPPPYAVGAPTLIPPRYVDTGYLVGPPYDEFGNAVLPPNTIYTYPPSGYPHGVPPPAVMRPSPQADPSPESAQPTEPLVAVDHHPPDPT